MIDEQELFTPAEAALYLRLQPTTLAIWRSQAKGPAYLKMGHSVRYRRTEVDRWLSGDDAEQERISNEAICHQGKRGSVKRLRGRRGAAQRLRRLQAEPLCRDCLDHGVERASEEVDHILQLVFGGSDDDDNVRCLCKPCHAIRSLEINGR